MTPRIPLSLSALAALTLLVSCSPSPAGPTTPSVSATTAAGPTPMATTQPSDEQTPASDEDPTCDTIITPGTVEALTSQGWTAQEQQLRIGDTVVAGGLLCMWADFSTASDHGQMYGWGPLDAAESRAAQSTLQRDGWLRSTDGEQVLFTEDPDYAIATDEDGFGMTYEFGDGWVRFSDTKQGLLLIDWEG